MIFAKYEDVEAVLIMHFCEKNDDDGSSLTHLCHPSTPAVGASILMMVEKSDITVLLLQ